MLVDIVGPERHAEPRLIGRSWGWLPFWIVGLKRPVWIGSSSHRGDDGKPTLTLVDNECMPWQCVIVKSRKAEASGFAELWAGRGVEEVPMLVPD